MHVVENKPHRIISDRKHLEDLHILLTADGAALARRVTLNLRARTAHAQIFGRQVEALTVFEDDGEGLPVLVQAQFRWPRTHSHTLIIAAARRRFTRA